MNKRDSGGQSLRETLAIVEATTGRVPAEGINPVELPDLLIEEWHWFLVLNRQRGETLTGPSTISEMDLWCFFNNRGMRAEEWQLDLIRRLDMTALKSVSKQSTPKPKTNPIPAQSRLGLRNR